MLASTHLQMEQVIRQVEIFLMLNEVYRQRRRRFSLLVHLIAALCNLNFLHA